MSTLREGREAPASLRGEGSLRQQLEALEARRSRLADGFEIAEPGVAEACDAALSLCRRAVTALDASVEEAEKLGLQFPSKPWVCRRCNTAFPWEATRREPIFPKCPDCGDYLCGENEIEKERTDAELARLRAEVGNKDRALHEKNLRLDAMHWVWCYGNCKDGEHRWTDGEITAEIVEIAEDGLDRMQRRLLNKGKKTARMVERDALRASEQRGRELLAALVDEFSCQSPRVSASGEYAVVTPCGDCWHCRATEDARAYCDSRAEGHLRSRAAAQAECGRCEGSGMVTAHIDEGGGWRESTRDVCPACNGTGKAQAEEASDA